MRDSVRKPGLFLCLHTNSCLFTSRRIVPTILKLALKYSPRLQSKDVFRLKRCIYDETQKLQMPTFLDSLERTSPVNSASDTAELHAQRYFKILENARASQTRGGRLVPTNEEFLDDVFEFIHGEYTTHPVFPSINTDLIRLFASLKNYKEGRQLRESEWPWQDIIVCLQALPFLGSSEEPGLDSPRQYHLDSLKLLEKAGITFDPTILSSLHAPQAQHDQGIYDIDCIGLALGQVPNTTALNDFRADPSDVLKTVLDSRKKRGARVCKIEDYEKLSVGCDVTSGYHATACGWHYCNWFINYERLRAAQNAASLQMQRDRIGTIVESLLDLESWTPDPLPSPAEILRRYKVVASNSKNPNPVMSKFIEETLRSQIRRRN